MAVCNQHDLIQLILLILLYEEKVRDNISKQRPELRSNSKAHVLFSLQTNKQTGQGLGHSQFSTVSPCSSFFSCLGYLFLPPPPGLPILVSALEPADHTRALKHFFGTYLIYKPFSMLNCFKSTSPVSTITVKSWRQKQKKNVEEITLHRVKALYKCKI